MNVHRLPIFPLNIVLFPQSSIHLHIFEPRYKKMISRCIEEQSEFGVNLLIAYNMKLIGCSARVDEVTQVYADGRMDIVIRGIRRYRTVKYVQHVDGYIIGDVEYINDVDEGIDSKKMYVAIELYNSIINIAFNKSEETGNDEGEYKLDSFRIAEKAGLELTERQTMLENLSENNRLTKLIQHLGQTIPKLKQIEMVQRMIRNDGYLSPKRQL